MTINVIPLNGCTPEPLHPPKEGQPEQYNVIPLRGCSTEPLGNYLKALGVFRLVAEQADPTARVWWEAGNLILTTHRFKSGDELISWLHNDCAYTAFLSPWSTNAGWGQGGKRDAGGQALQKLLQDGKHRTARFRLAADALVNLVCPGTKRMPEQLPVDIPAVANWVANHNEAEIIARLRNHVAENWLIDWLDSVAGVQVESRGSNLIHRWFPLFAKGGAEGSGNYIVRQQQYLASSFCEDSVNGLARLRAAVTGGSVTQGLQQNALAGLFFPGFRGDPNIGQSFDVQPRVNPWDFILLLEGLLLFRSSVTRKLGASRSDAAFPFYCEAALGGATTVGLREIPEADKSISSGEIWCPLWDKPTNLNVLQSILSEGRFQVGGRTVRKATQFALSVARYGVDRGINAFVRYGLIRRSGSYGKQDRTVPLAVPIGSFPVFLDNTLVLLEFLLEFDDRLSRHVPNSELTVALGAGNNHPMRLLQARIAYDNAFFSAASAVQYNDNNAARSKTDSALVDVLVSLSNLVREFAVTKGTIRSGRGGKARVPKQPNAPLPRPLSREWARLKPYTFQREFSLSKAIAGITPWRNSKAEGSNEIVVGDLCSNLLPVTRRGSFWQWDAKSRFQAWAPGTTLFDNMTAVLRRRLMDAAKVDGEGLPLWSIYGASFSDLLALWSSELSEEKLSDLIHALALIDTGHWKPENIDHTQKATDPSPELHSNAVWFDAEDQPRIEISPIVWRNGTLVNKDELRSAFALPRVYALLKLCFVGGRLPARPVEKVTVGRTGDEPYPPKAPEILNLLQAGRLSEAVGIAVHKLRAKGYPPIFDHRGKTALEFDMSLADCRRLAGMLLIPVKHVGVLAALSIKPCIRNR